MFIIPLVAPKLYPQSVLCLLHVGKPSRLRCPNWNEITTIRPKGRLCWRPDVDKLFPQVMILVDKNTINEAKSK